MPDARTRGRGSWIGKFRNAFRGIAVGVRGESSFVVHLLVTAAVVLAAIVVGASATEWCLLLLCVVLVLAVELLNTAVERLVRIVHPEQHPAIRDCLDITSGAVLVASLGAALIGAIILSPRLLAVLAPMIGR